MTEPSVTTPEGRAALRECMDEVGWPLFWRTWMGRALDQLDARDAERDEEELLRELMADILTRTANALKGEPPPLTRHSWHDLPEVAKRIVEDR